MSQSSASTVAAMTMSDHAKALPTLEVMVGTRHQRYFLHRSLLSVKSKYFSDRLNGVAVPSDLSLLARLDPTVFDDFVDWLYHGAPQSCPDKWALVDIYLVATDLECPGLKDWVMGDLHMQLSRQDPDIAFVRDAILRAPAASMLRIFLIKKTGHIMAASRSVKWQQMYNIDPEVGELLRKVVRDFKNNPVPVDPARQQAYLWREPESELLPADEADYVLI